MRGPRQGINRAELLAFAQALRATSGRELGYITDCAYTCRRLAAVDVKALAAEAPPRPPERSSATGCWGGSMELLQVESHIELEKVEGLGLCHGTHACQNGDG